MIRYDAEIRRLMVAQGGLEAKMLDFLLGRPVEYVLRLFERQAEGGAEPEPPRVEA